MSIESCQAAGLYFCNVNREPTCVSSLSECVSHITGCPVNKPIRCGDQCKDKPCRGDCDGCIPAVKQDCPIQCPNGECKQMEYSLANSDQACGFSSVRQNQFGKIMGTCANGEISSDCSTCNFWCASTKTCAYSSNECSEQTMCGIDTPV